MSIPTPDISVRPLAGKTTPGVSEYHTYSALVEINSACSVKVSPEAQESKSPGSVKVVLTCVSEALPKKSYGPAKSLSADVNDADVLDLVIIALKGESHAAPLPNRARGSKPNCVKLMPTSAK